MSEHVVIVGIDPAPAESGLSLLFPEEKKFVTYHYVSDKMRQSFSCWFQRAYDIASLITERINSIPCARICAVMEVAPPNGQYSPVMYGLNFLILSLLKRSKEKEWVKLILVQPNYLQHLVGRRCEKEDIRDMAKCVAKMNGISFNKENMTYHETDAALLALWICHNIGKYRMELPSDPIHKNVEKNWKMEAVHVESAPYLQNTGVELYA